ncbi:hypothetical protein ElyMa_005975300 [Elysia marginata]|uniref:Uncharacterized protein n=1 Tax=Elysia marginata TaxID=1093978 RepID=A0AAV4GDT9_9GAST|nr:hypothetical protein ElyMa_005975300 [Elysia marginata]
MSSVMDDPDNVLDDLQAYLSQFSVDDSLVSDGSEFGSGSGVGVFAFPSPTSLTPRTPRTPRTPGRTPRAENPVTPGSGTPRLNSARSTVSGKIKSAHSGGPKSHSPGPSSLRQNGFVLPEHHKVESPKIKSYEKGGSSPTAKGSTGKRENHSIHSNVPNNVHIASSDVVKESETYRTPRLIHVSKKKKKKSTVAEPKPVQSNAGELSPFQVTDSETSTSFTREVKRYNGVSGLESDLSEVQRARYYGGKEEVIESASDSQRTDIDEDFGEDSQISKSEPVENSREEKFEENSSRRNFGEVTHEEKSHVERISKETSEDERDGENLGNIVSEENAGEVGSTVISDEENSTANISHVLGEAEDNRVNSALSTSSFDVKFPVLSDDEKKISEREEGDLSKVLTPRDEESKPRESGEEEAEQLTPEFSPLTHPSDEGPNFSPVSPELSTGAEVKREGSVSSRGSLARSSLGARPTTLGRESMGNKHTVDGRSRSASTGQHEKSLEENSSDDAMARSSQCSGKEKSKAETSEYTYFHFGESDVSPCVVPDCEVRASDLFDGPQVQNLSSTDSNQKPETYTVLPSGGEDNTAEEEDPTYSSLDTDRSGLIEENTSTLKIRRHPATAENDREDTAEISVTEEPIYATVNKARKLATEAVLVRVQDVCADSVSEDERSEQVLSEQEESVSKSDQAALNSASADETDEAITTDSERRYESTSDSDVIVLPIFGRTRRNLASKKYTEVLKELSVVLENRTQATRTQSMKTDRADAAAALGVTKDKDSTRDGAARPLSKSSENVNNVFVNKSLLSMLERHLVNKTESDKIIKPGVSNGGDDGGSGSTGIGGQGVNSENVVRVLKNREAVSATPPGTRENRLDSSSSGAKSPVTDSKDYPRGMPANSGPSNAFTPVEQKQSQSLHSQPGFSPNYEQSGRKTGVKPPVDTYGKRVSAKLIYNHSALLSPPKPTSPVSSYDAEVVSSADETSNILSSSSEGLLETIYSENKTSGPEEDHSMSAHSTSLGAGVDQNQYQHRKSPDEKAFSPPLTVTKHSLSWARASDLRPSPEQRKFISVSSHHNQELFTPTKVKGQKSAAPLRHHSSMHTVGAIASPRRHVARKLNKSMDANHVTTIHITGRGLQRQGKITYSEPDLIHALNQSQEASNSNGRTSITVNPQRWREDVNRSRVSSLYDTSRSKQGFIDTSRGNASASNFSLNASISNNISFGNETFDPDESVQFDKTGGPTNYSFDHSMYRSLVDGEELLTAGYQMVRVNVGSRSDTESVEIPFAQVPTSASIQDARSLGNDTYFISTGEGCTPLPVTIVRSRSSSFTAFGGGSSSGRSSSGDRSSRRPSPDRRSPLKQASHHTVMQRHHSPSRHSHHVSPFPSPRSPTFSSTIYNHPQSQYHHTQHRQSGYGNSQTTAVMRTVSLRSSAAAGTVQAKLSRSQTFDRGRPSQTSSNFNTLYRVTNQQQVHHQPIYSKKQQQQQQQHHSPRSYDAHASEGNLTRSYVYSGTSSNLNFSTISGYSRFQRGIPDDQVSNTSEASEASHLYVVLPTDGPRPVGAAPQAVKEREPQQHWQHQRRLPPDGRLG